MPVAKITVDGLEPPPTMKKTAGRSDPAVSKRVQSLTQLHPLVPPHVSHFRQVPFRTSVKFPHEPQASPS